MMEVNQVQMGDRSFIRYTWVDVVTELALNALLLASGVGLLHWRPWARRLGLWTAGLKVVHLVLLYGYLAPSRSSPRTPDAWARRPPR